jgi:hypothetical protein
MPQFGSRDREYSSKTNLSVNIPCDKGILAMILRFIFPCIDIGFGIKEKNDCTVHYQRFVQEKTSDKIARTSNETEV